MKKLVFVVGWLFVSGIAKADNFCTDWGKVNVCLPIASGVEGAFGYDFKGKQSQGLGATPIAKWNVHANHYLTLKFGGVTTANGKGAPFLGLDYNVNIPNPTGINTITPGIYVGHDWHIHEDFYGVKFAVPIISNN